MFDFSQATILETLALHSAVWGLDLNVNTAGRPASVQDLVEGLFAQIKTIRAVDAAEVKAPYFQGAWLSIMTPEALFICKQGLLNTLKTYANGSNGPSGFMIDCCKAAGLTVEAAIQTVLQQVMQSEIQVELYQVNQRYPMRRTAAPDYEIYEWYYPGDDIINASPLVKFSRYDDVLTSLALPTRLNLTQSEAFRLAEILLLAIAVHTALQAGDAWDRDLPDVVPL